MSNIKGSETEQNLLKSFAGESQARNRYSYFSGVARKEGFVQISRVFEETANHEKEHAKRFFKQLQGGDLIINAAYPAGMIGGTVDNLKEAAAGEYHEWSDLYPSFAKIARAEGFEAAAKVWEAVSISEKFHEKRYLGLLKNVESGAVFNRDKHVVWQCINCGYTHEGLDAPDMCPACAHPKAYYELLAENW